jgi:hypothetical protein
MTVSVASKEYQESRMMNHKMVGGGAGGGGNMATKRSSKSDRTRAVSQYVAVGTVRK